MPERPSAVRRRTPVRRVVARPRTPARPPAPRAVVAPRAPTPIPLPPPAPWREPELQPGLRFIAWAMIFGGFAGIVAAVGGTLVLAHDAEAFAPQRDLRFGLVAGSAGVLALDALAIAAGLRLLAIREWGRLATVVLCTIGLFGSVVAAGVAYFGGLLTTWAPVPGGLVGLVLVATITAGIFFGWALPLLLDSSTVEMFRENERRAGAHGRVAVRSFT